MSCTTVKITRVGEIGAGAELSSEGIRAGLTRDAIGVRCSKMQTGIAATLSHDAIRARLSMVCRPSIREPYLEISPEILWVYSDLEQYNDVLSNTYWNVN
jgi:hypothetical protein